MPSPPTDLALEERVARAVWRDPTHEERFLVSRALAALTTEDLRALLSARSDEVVVSFTREEAEALERAEWRLLAEDFQLGSPLMKVRAKLSTALEGE